MLRNRLVAVSLSSGRVGVYHVVRAVTDHLRVFCFPLGRAGKRWTDQAGAVSLVLGSWTMCKLK